MTVRDLLALIRFHEPDTEVAMALHRSDIRPVERVDLVWRVERGIVPLLQVAPIEAATAVPVVCLWPE